MKDKKTKYYFDKEAADRAVNFIQEFITHTKGELAGQPLILEKWQREIVEKIFGWKNKKTNLRQYRTCFIMLGRKNGKTTLTAGIGLYMLFADEEKGSEIYAAAGDRNQAGLVHEIAKGMILNNPELTARAKILRNSIVNESKGNYFQAISSDSKTKHGFNANCVIFDELHTQVNRSLWDTLHTSTASRRQPLVVAITTAGYDKQSICYEVYSYAKKVLDGSIKDDSFLPIIYEAEDGDDITLEETWKKANPNYGVSLKKEYMQRESKKAIDIPSYLNSYLRLHLSQWTENEIKWMGDKEWMECEGELGDLSNMECWGGLDLATTRDITAFVLIFRVDNIFKIKPYFFVPRDNAKARSDRDGVDYMSWISQGHIIATEGNVTDYSFVRKKINELSKKYRIQSIAYDRWNASQITIDLMSDGATLSPIGMGFASQVAATIMALAEYMTEEKEGDSVYDNRGLLML